MLESLLRCVALAAAATPLLVACGGGTAGDPGSISPSQCSGSTCTNEGPPPSAAAATALCPSDATIAAETFLGGAGSGEVVSLNIDPTKMTYSLTFLASPIPASSSGLLQNTRAGLTLTGAVQHPPAGSLPSASQIACAFQLQPGTGTVGGNPYTMYYNANNPPTIYVGFGVAGGGIPGADVDFSGDSEAALIFGDIQRNFDFFPFIGFSSVSTSIADLQGSYNSMLYHILPSGNFTSAAVAAQEQYDANGNCSVPPGASNTSCDTATSRWTADASGSYFDSSNPPSLEPPAGLGSLFSLTRNGATAHLILGKLNNKIVPVVVRTGYVNEGTLQVDDESGIALMSPATPLAMNSIDGSYIGADSNFAYTATLVNGTSGGFLKPSTMTTESQFTLDYTQTQPGLLGVTDASGKTGDMIAVGGLYAIFIDGPENGGVTPSSANAGTPQQPYFAAGALIQPQ